MKKRREGTLERSERTPPDTGQGWLADLEAAIDQFREAGGMFGLDDFLNRADAIAAEMIEAGDGTLRRSRGESLRRSVQRLRLALQRGADRDLIFWAVDAGLAFARLTHERDDDEQQKGRSKAPQPFGRSDYLAAKRKAASREELCELLGGVSDQGLRKWEERNFDE